MSTLEISNLTHTYINKRTKESCLALDNISLSFPLGKTTAIIGKIGSGKTTLLKIIGGILPYDEGSLIYDGVDLDTAYVEDRNFSYVSQTPLLYPKKTVFDNLALPLLEAKQKKEAIRETIYEVSRDYKIDYLLTRKPKELSIGQIQTINFVKATLKKPELFLLDEPFSNLDLKSNLRMRKKLKEILLETKATCLLATHNINDVLYLADYIVVLEEGKVVASSSKEELFQSKDPIVRSLLHAEEKENEEQQ